MLLYYYNEKIVYRRHHNDCGVFFYAIRKDNRMITTPNGYQVNTSKDRAKFYSSKEWQELRQEAMKRDNYECVWCASEGKVSTNQVLEVDHIKELEYYPQDALDIHNLRTLCKDCHNKRHKRFNYIDKQKKHKRKYSSATFEEWW